MFNANPPTDTVLIGHGSAHEIEHPFYAVKKLKALPAKTSANKTEEISSSNAANKNAQKPLLGVSMATLREVGELVDEVLRLESLLLSWPSHETKHQCQR